MGSHSNVLYFLMGSCTCYCLSDDVLRLSMACTRKYAGPLRNKKKCSLQNNEFSVIYRPVEPSVKQLNSVQENELNTFTIYRDTAIISTKTD